MNGWRGSWARAQITGALFSSLVWIVVWGLSLSALVVMLAVGIALVIGRNSRALLWWRLGARPANDFERDTVLTAIVPIVSLRGRRQPSIWIGRRIGRGDVVMPSSTVLVVRPEFFRRVAGGQLTDRQASAVVSHALGQHLANNSVLVNAVDLYCLPWRVARLFISAASHVAGRIPIVDFAWKMRWVVFTAAAVDAYRSQRWAGLSGVLIIAVLSWSTGHFQNRWAQLLQDLGDQRAIAEHLGKDLAHLVRLHDQSLAGSERAVKLSHARPIGVKPAC